MIETVRVFVDGNPDILGNVFTAGPFWQYPGREGLFVVDNATEADVIYHDVGISYVSVNDVDPATYAAFGEKYVWYSTTDKPQLAYDSKQIGIKVLPQPLRGPEANREHRIIAAPLTMAQVEWPIVSDMKFLESCRATKKRYNFIFMGKVTPSSHRGFLRKLKLPAYHLKVRMRSFFNQNTGRKSQQSKMFMQDLAKSKYAFAPRGEGSSSFRLYQAMSVGTVPIVSGMKEYPFADEADWTKFAIIADDHLIDADVLLGDDAKWQRMSQAAIKFWEEYVYIPRMYDKLTAAIKRELTPG